MVPDDASLIEASVAGTRLIFPSQDRQLAVGPVVPGLLVQAAQTRSSWLVPGVAVLLVMTAATFAFFYRPPVASAPMQAVQQIVPRVVETPTPSEQAAQAAKADPVVTPQELIVTPATDSDGTDKRPVRASPGTTNVRSVPPLPVTGTQPTARQEPPAVKDCSPAVATLGLCNP